MDQRLSYITWLIIPGILFGYLASFITAIAGFSVPTILLLAVSGGDTIAAMSMLPRNHGYAGPMLVSWVLGSAVGLLAHVSLSLAMFLGGPVILFLVLAWTMVLYKKKEKHET